MTSLRRFFSYKHIPSHQLSLHKVYMTFCRSEGCPGNNAPRSVLMKFKKALRHCPDVYVDVDYRRTPRGTNSMPVYGKLPEDFDRAVSLSILDDLLELAGE